MFYFKKGKIHIIMLLSLLFFLLSLQQSSAVTILPGCATTGDCSVCEIVQTAVNIGVFILGIVGGLVLAVFVYGGTVWLLSAGRDAWVKKGKEALVNAVIGLAIVFSAYMLVNFIIFAVRGGKEWKWQEQLKCPTTSSSQSQTTGPSGGGEFGTTGAGASW